MAPVTDAATEPGGYGNGAGPPGRGDRPRLRHAADAVPRPRRRDPEPQEAHGRRDVGRPRQHHPADHCACVGVRHDRHDPRPAGDLRLPQPQGPHLRRPVDRHGRCGEGPGRLGQARRAGTELAPDRRAPSFPPPKQFPGGASAASSRHPARIPSRTRSRSRPRSPRSSARATTTSSISRTSASRATISRSIRSSR